MDAAPAPDSKSDFRTIAHSGGTVTIDVSLDPATNRKRYQLTWNHCRPNAGGLFAVYALPPGIVISQMNLGGIGSPIDPPPIPGCYQVFVVPIAKENMAANAPPATATGGANWDSFALTAGFPERLSIS
jgi:hypothetical protein